MRWLGYVVGVLLVLMGAVWFLQGINVLPGSFMTGQIQWAIAGAISFVVGAGIIVLLQRRQSPSA
jgi:hypothetical protein